MIKNNVFENLDELNKFVENNKNIKVINVNRIYRNHEILNNVYNLVCVGYELIYFD